MYFVYIIYSKLLNRFYIGSTANVEERLKEHNTSKYQQSFTRLAGDWELFFVLTCSNISQGRRIEQHIKMMKSRKYIENLKKYPELAKELLNRF